MSSASIPRNSRATLLLIFLMLVWLLTLSAMVALGYRLILAQASREQVDAGLKQLHVLEASVAELANTVKMLQAQPAAATAAALQDTHQTLGARMSQLEQALADRVVAAELDALRIEIAQLQAHPPIIQPTTPVPAKPRAKPAAATPPRKESIPFRVLGAELRAGQRALSIAPATGELTAEQIQVLLPGESLGPWRLEALDSNTAVFRAGQQVHRLAIP